MKGCTHFQNTSNIYPYSCCRHHSKCYLKLVSYLKIISWEFEGTRVLEYLRKRVMYLEYQDDNETLKINNCQVKAGAWKAIDLYVKTRIFLSSFVNDWALLRKWMMDTRTSTNVLVLDLYASKMKKWFTITKSTTLLARWSMRIAISLSCFLTPIITVLIIASVWGYRGHSSTESATFLTVIFYPFLDRKYFWIYG